MKLTRLLTFLFLFSLCLTSVAGTQYESDGIIYETDDYGSGYEVAVVGNLITLSTPVYIPSTVVLEGITYTVTSIGTSAFENCKAMTAVTIPSTIKSIGIAAFQYCTGLRSVTIPNSVTVIKDWAFYDCTNLSSLYLSNSLREIGDFAFGKCTSLTEVSLPASLGEVGRYIFTECTALQRVDIPSNCIQIDEGAFSNCYNLYDFEIPSSLIWIEEFAFVHCYSITSLTMPKSLRKIGDYAFAECEGLMEVDLGEASVTIGTGTFGGATSLKTVTGTEYLETIGSLGFANCYELESVEENTLLTTVGDSAFHDCYKLEYVHLPNSVQSMGVGAYRDCKNLSQVNIPDSVETIGNSAFNGCNFSSVAIPAELKELGSFAFSECNKIMEVYYNTNDPISADTTVFSNTVYANAFLYVADGGKEKAGNTSPWSKFKKIVELSEIKNVEAGEKFEYGGLKYEVISPDDMNVRVIPMVDGIDINYEGSAYPDMSRLLQYYQLFVPAIVDNGSRWFKVTEVGDYAFFRCPFERVNFGGDITSVGYAAFYGCTSLNNLSLKKAKTIGAYAFGQDPNLTTVQFSDELTSLGEYAFYGCSKLTDVNLAYKNIKEISSGLFNKCSALKAISIPENIRIIGDKAFSECSNINEIILTDSITEIGESAFANCERLKTVTLSKNLMSMGDNAFASCDSITHIYYNSATPVSGNNNIFSEVAYGNALLYVAEGGLQNAMSADPWKNFENIRESATQGNVGYRFTVDGIWYEIKDAVARYVEVTYANDRAPLGENAYGNYAATMLYKNVSYNGVDYTVVGIGDFAFANMPSLLDVSIYGTDFTETFRIGKYAFANCKELYIVSFPWAGSGVAVDIDDFAFYNSQVRGEFGSAVHIGKSAFEGCSQLSSYSIRNSESCVIEEDAFKGCESLYTLIVETPDLTLEGNIASGCSSLTRVDIKCDNLNVTGDPFAGTDKEYIYLYINGEDFAERSERLGIPTIMNGNMYAVAADSLTYHYTDFSPYVASVNTKVPLIDKYARMNNKNLYGVDSISIPATISLSVPETISATGTKEFPVVRVMDAAFYGSPLRKVKLPSSIRYIDKDAFDFAEEDGGVLRVETSTPPRCYGFKDYTYQNVTLEVPQGTSHIYSKALPWSNFAKVREVYVAGGPDVAPEGTTFTYGDLKYKIISTTATGSPEVAVIYSGEMTESGGPVNGDPSYPELFGKVVTIPSSVPYVGVDYKVTEIGRCAFSQCDVAGINLPPTIKTTQIGAFDNFSYIPYINVTDIASFCSIDAQSPIWYVNELRHNGEPVTDLVIPDECTRIGSLAFYGAKFLKSVTITPSVAQIGEGAFSYTRNLKSVEISDSDVPLVSEKSPFIGSGLERAYIGRVVQGGMFCYSDSLRTVTFCERFQDVQGRIGISKAISDSMFYKCENLVDVRIPDNVEAIGRYAFADCSKLNLSELPESVTSIEDYAFNSSGVSFGYIPAGVRRIGEYAFYGCWNLDLYELPSSLEAIGKGAFSRASFSAGTTLRIPGDVGEIPDYAFSNVTNLSSVVLEEGITSVGEAFSGNQNLVEVVIPHSIQLIKSKAFSGCKNIGTVISKSEMPALSDMPYAYGDIFESGVYSSARLLVPVGCRQNYTDIGYDDPYRLHWTGFSDANIEESTLAGIGVITADAESGVVVTAEGGRICAAGAPEDAVMEVYDAAGRMVHRGGHRTEPLVSGMYIVRIGSTVTKVRL